MKDIILGRRSIRKYTDYKIPQKELENMINDALRAPSSRNLQPVRLFIFETPSAKEKLRPLLYGNQLQLDTASHLILVTADARKHELAHLIFDRAYEQGKMSLEVRNRHTESFKNLNYDSVDTSYLNALHLDAGLFSMNFMLVSRIYGYDTCAIGGFDKKSINQTLDIDTRYVPVLLISVGKADDTGYESLRFDAKEITNYID